MSDRVPTRFVKTLLRMVVNKGHDFTGILCAAGLEFDPFDPDAPNYRNEISAMQYSQVYQEALRLLQDETFGTVGSDMAAPGAFRMMCYCIISCDSLGQAILRAAEFYRTFFDERSQLYADFSDRWARVGYVTVGQRDAHRVRAADAYGLSLWHRFFGWLVDRPIPLQRVDFSGDPPPNEDKYANLFACPLYFSQPSDLLYFDEECLSWPLVHTAHTLADFLRTAPYQLLLMDCHSQGDNLTAQVRAMIGRDFRDGCPTFETISSALNMSAPTLRRRLKHEGTTYQRIKDETRCEAAKLCLDRRDMSVNQVALELGFTDPSAFHRSFRKWTGQTPGQFRTGRRRRDT